MSHDTLIHRLVRPLVRPLGRTRVTPNQLTTVRLVTGLAAGAAFAVGWRAVGAGLFLVSLLLDRADGELARQTARASAGGYRYDLVCDCVATVAAFLGLGFGLRGTLGPLAIGLGGLAGVSVVGVFYQLNGARPASPRGVDAHRRSWVDPDDAMVGLPLLIWLGQAQAALVAASVLTPAVLVALMLLARRRSQPPAGTRAQSGANSPKE